MLKLESYLKNKSLKIEKNGKPTFEISFWVQKQKIYYLKNTYARVDGAPFVVCYQKMRNRDSLSWSEVELERSL